MGCCERAHARWPGMERLGETHRRNGKALICSWLPSALGRMRSGEGSGRVLTKPITDRSGDLHAKAPW
jgi:hypothetical protein